MSKMKIALKWLRYIAINSVFAAAIYFGMFAEMHGGTNISGAGNLALFMGWITGLMGTFILIGLMLNERSENSDALKEQLARTVDPSVIPFPVDLVFDLIVIGAFVWSGYIWLALFYIMSVFAGKQLRDLPKNLVLNKLKSQKS